MELTKLPGGKECYLSPDLESHLYLNKYFLEKERGREVSSYEASRDFFLDPEKIESAINGGLEFPRKFLLCSACSDISTPDGYVICEGKYSDRFLDEFITKCGDYHHKSNIELDISSTDGVCCAHVGPIEVSGTPCKECLDIRMDKSKKEESKRLINNNLKAWRSSVFSFIFPEHLQELASNSV